MIKYLFFTTPFSPVADGGAPMSWFANPDKLQKMLNNLALLILILYMKKVTENPH